MSETRDELISNLTKLNEEIGEETDKKKIMYEAANLTNKIQNLNTAIFPENPISEESKKKALEQILKVDIDVGIFKYVLIFIPSYDTYIIRGNRQVEYHYQCALPVIEELANYGIHSGGGRMMHDPEMKNLEIYGFSYSYGMADHDLVAKLISGHLGQDYNIKTRNSGY